MVSSVWGIGARAGLRLDHEGTALGKSGAGAKGIDIVAGAGLSGDGGRA